MSKRIRYTENSDGTQFSSPKFLAGKIWVMAHMNLKTNTFVIQNTETNRHVGASVTFTNKAQGMKKIKQTLVALGVIFDTENRDTSREPTITQNGP